MAESFESMYVKLVINYLFWSYCAIGIETIEIKFVWIINFRISATDSLIDEINSIVAEEDRAIIKRDETKIALVCKDAEAKLYSTLAYY